MKKIVATLLALSLILSTTACGGSGSTTSSTPDAPNTTDSPTAKPAEKIVLKIGNSQPDNHPWNQGITELTRLADEYSSGQIEIVNYPNATLGSEPDMLESVKEGSLDMVVTDPTVGTTFCKELELFALPFLFQDFDHWQRVLDGEIGAEYANLIEEKSGIKILAYWGGSTRNVLAVKKPVESIDDLQGFKLRLAPSELKFKVWEAIGTLPVTIAFGETYSAMASGLCDGMENEMPSILASKFYEPAPHFTMTAHEITVRPVFINADKFNSLSPELQEALTKAIAEATTFARECEKQSAQEAQEQMVGQFDVKLYEIDKQPIMERTRPIFEEFGKNSGLTDLIAKIQAA